MEAEEERDLVTRLLKGVTHPASWRYTFHLLCNVEDPASKNGSKAAL
jgi:hypothetical protein